MRHSYLDNLRACLTAFVIVFHTSIAYGAAGSWIYRDSSSSAVTGTVILLTNFVLIGQAFGLSLFFFISAYFTPASCDRRGIRRFLRERLLRLGVPMAVYYLFIGPFTIWFSNDRNMSLPLYYMHDVLSFRSTFFGPTWFLEALIYFSLAYAGIRLFAEKRVRARRPIPFPTHLQLLSFAILFGLIAFVVRLAYPVGTGPLELQLGFFPLYILAMATGVIAYRNQWLDRLPTPIVRQWTILALVITPLLPIALILTGALHGVVNAQGGWHLQALFYALWEPFLCFGFSMGLLQLFKRRFNRPTNPFHHFFSRNAYAAYVVHPPVVVGFTMLFHQVPLPELLKFALVAPLSVLVSFLIALGIRIVIRRFPQNGIPVVGL